ncbi:hypothetical protein VTO42DRAFT_3041 [Malbranchea cinnamomea]
MHEGVTPPYCPPYPMSGTELEALRKYLKVAQTDSAATSHVLNAAQKDRLTNLHPANGEFLTHGDTRTMIEAFSDAYVKPDEGKYFVLRDVVYVPSFQSSLVSLQKAHLAGWSYKAERGEQLGLGLYKLNGVKAATAILNKGLYCLEYRPNPCSAFATTTQKTFAKPLSSSVTIELWRSSEELHEEVSDIIETIHVPERSIHFENSTPLLEFDIEDLAMESLEKPTTEALIEATEQATPSLKETLAPGTKDLPADVPDHLPTPEPTPEPMLETMDAVPTDPLDDSTPCHADLSYNAPYDDVEGLDPSDFNPAAQLALDLDTFMDTNLPLEAENPTNPISIVMPDSFDFNNPTPCTNITPRSNEVSADFSEVNIIEESVNKKAIHKSNLPPAPHTWKEMQRHKFLDHWYKAAEVEIKKLQERGTYKIFPIPYRKQIIPLMWAFIYKFDDKEFLLKFKPEH